ncbi:hypothetical protein LguiB_027731 [Lonicera macranthoides]
MALDPTNAAESLELNLSALIIIHKKVSNVGNDGSRDHNEDFEHDYATPKSNRKKAKVMKGKANVVDPVEEDNKGFESDYANSDKLTSIHSSDEMQLETMVFKLSRESSFSFLLSMVQTNPSPAPQNIEGQAIEEAKSIQISTLKSSQSRPGSHASVITNSDLASPRNSVN